MHNYMKLTKQELLDIIKCINESHQPKSNSKNSKKCDPDKIYNPTTQRCVKRSGVTGKKLVAAMKKHENYDSNNDLPLKDKLKKNKLKGVLK